MGTARNRNLDILRSAAILLVLGIHVPAYDGWVKVGWLGVDLFFVLSGFLISNLVFREYQKFGRISLRSFYIRRAFKLYPAFYLLIIASALYCLLAGIPLAIRSVFAELLFVQNYAGGLWGHTWSLAVEEHFYILLPLTLAALIRYGRRPDPFRRLPWIFLAVAVLCLTLRIIAWKTQPFSYASHFQRSHLRFDSLLFGVLLSYWSNFRPDILEALTGRYRQLVFLVSFVALLPSLLLPNTLPLIYTVGFSLVYVSFGGLLLIALYDKKGQLATAKPAGIVETGFASIGVFSYSIYLWHVPLAMASAAFYDWQKARHWDLHPQLLFWIYIVVSIGFGAAMSKLVELPLLAFRDRLIPARADAGMQNQSGVQAIPHSPVAKLPVAQ